MLYEKKSILEHEETSGNFSEGFFTCEHASVFVCFDSLRPSQQLFSYSISGRVFLD